MFRKMRRFKQELSNSECAEILKTEKRGVLSVIGDDGYPYGVPLDYYYNDAEGAVYFHSAKEGHKIDAMNNCEKVCFTVFEKEGTKRPEDWSYDVSSVVIFGKAGEVTDENEKLLMARAFGMKYYPTEKELEEEIKKDIHRMRLTRISIEHMSGKRVHEK